MVHGRLVPQEEYQHFMRDKQVYFETLEWLEFWVYNCENQLTESLKLQKVAKILTKKKIKSKWKGFTKNVNFIKEMSCSKKWTCLNLARLFSILVSLPGLLFKHFSEYINLVSSLLWQFKALKTAMNCNVKWGHRGFFLDLAWARYWMWKKKSHNQHKLHKAWIPLKLYSKGIVKLKYGTNPIREDVFNAISPVKILIPSCKKSKHM